MLKNPQFLSVDNTRNVANEVLSAAFSSLTTAGVTPAEASQIVKRNFVRVNHNSQLRLCVEELTKRT